MVSDSTENIQWGLINMGGYTNFNGLTPLQRQAEVYVGVRKLDSCRNYGHATLFECC